MFLAKIVGKIVSVTKNEGLPGKKILIAVPINMNDEVIGGEIISLDNVGAGIGDKVLIATGDVARFAFDDKKDYPIDSAIISIVDSVEQS